MIANHIILSDMMKEGTETFSADRASQHQDQDQKLWLSLYCKQRYHCDTFRTQKLALEYLHNILIIGKPQQH